MSFMHFRERSGGRLKNCWEKFFVCQLIVSLMILAPAALLKAHAQITVQNPSGAEVVSIVVDAKKRDGRPWDGPGALDYQSGESDREGAIGLLKGLMKEAEKFVDQRVVAPDVSICILNLGPTSFGIAAGSTHCMNAADNLSRTRLTDSLAHEILRNDKVAVLLWDRDVAGCHDVIGAAILASRGDPAYSISARDEELVRRDVLQARSRCPVKEPLISQFRVDALSTDRCTSGCRIGAAQAQFAANARQQRREQTRRNGQRSNAERWYTFIVPNGQLGEFDHGTFPSLGSKTHPGVDITAPCEGEARSEVRAWDAGRVVDVIDHRGDRNFDSLGYMVIIAHDNLADGRPVFSVYFHLKEPPLVERDQRIETGGETIGYVGNTGAVRGPTGCHLHFEVRHFEGRFHLHPKWRNIYGNGDRRQSSEFLEYWSDPATFRR